MVENRFAKVNGFEVDCLERKVILDITSIHVGVQTTVQCNLSSKLLPDILDFRTFGDAYVITAPWGGIKPNVDIAVNMKLVDVDITRLHESRRRETFVWSHYASVHNTATSHLGLYLRLVNSLLASPEYP